MAGDALTGPTAISTDHSDATSLLRHRGAAELNGKQLLKHAFVGVRLSRDAFPVASFSGWAEVEVHTTQALSVTPEAPR